MDKGISIPLRVYQVFLATGKTLLNRYINIAYIFLQNSDFFLNFFLEICLMLASQIE